MAGEWGLLNYGLTAVMALLALGLVFVAAYWRVQPIFLMPGAAGLLLANLPLPEVSATLAPFLKAIQSGLAHGVYASLILLCRGAGFDLSYLIAHPRQLFLGLFNALAFLAILAVGWKLGFSPTLAGGTALIGSGDGVSSIFLAGYLDLSQVGPRGLAAFALSGLALRLQPGLVGLLTSRQERMIRMAPIRRVARRENLVFVVVGLILTALLVPGALVLTGMFFLGNLIRESGVAERLARTLSNRLGDLLLALMGLAVGSMCRVADIFCAAFGQILILGIVSLLLVSVVAVMAIKASNLFTARKINPLVGGAALGGLIPDAAQMAQVMARREDPHNNLYAHALASSQAALLAATLTAGLFLSLLGGK
jgi:sodium ion-translocating decarboxylase beta subunit